MGLEERRTSEDGMKQREVGIGRQQSILNDKAKVVQIVRHLMQWGSAIEGSLCTEAVSSLCGEEAR